MKIYRHLAICLVSVFLGGETSASTPTNRINETVQIGQSFGIWVDADVALNQQKFLNPEHFREFFSTFADLNKTNLETYSFLYPDEFWALNRYLTKLFSNKEISVTELRDYRNATVLGINGYQNLKSQPDKNVTRKLPEVTDSPELDYFIALALRSTDPQNIENLIREDIQTAINEAITQKTESIFSEWFPNTRIRSRLSSAGTSEFNLGFITPLIDNPKSNLFGQTMVSKTDSQHQFSQGIGFRSLDSHQANVFGANIFVDHQPDTGHRRGSVGFELLSNSKKFFANRYFPLSDYKEGADRALQRPADGYDAIAHLAVPYFPDFYITYAIEAWNYGGEKKSMVRSLGLKGELLPKLTLEIQHQKSTGTSQDRVLASLTYNKLSDGHMGTSPYEVRDPYQVFNDYRYQFVERNYSMPLNTNCPAVSFENSSFETDSPDSEVFSGWTAVNEQIILGESTIIGHLTPIDGTIPNSSPGDNQPADIGSIQTIIVNESSDGDQSLRLVTEGIVSTSFAVIRGPAIYSSDTVALEPGDLVSFDWKAENGEDSFDVFGYFYNESNGQFFEVLNETGDVTDWNTATFITPTTGDYRFVFVSGSYDGTGGEVLGASLYLDNVSVTANLSACQSLQNQ